MSGPADVLVTAIGQAPTTSGDLAANAASAARLAEQAAASGAQLLVLPEAFLTGSDEDLLAAGTFPRPADLPGLLEPVAEVARAEALTVVLSTPLRRVPERATMTTVVVGPHDPPGTPYDKQHVHPDEAAWLSPGDGGAVTALHGWELGLAICNDVNHAGHARAARAAGADAYVVSSAWFAGSEQRRDAVLAERAREHGWWVVAACALGSSRGRDLVGGSGVWAPDGRRVTPALGAEGRGEGVVVATLTRDRGHDAVTRG